MIYLGIDPGLSSGGVAAIYPSTPGCAHQPYPETPSTVSVEAGAWKMPQTETDLVELIESIVHMGVGADGVVPMNEPFAMVEKVWGMWPGTYKKVRCRHCGQWNTVKAAQGISSTSKFMQNFGIIKGVLAALKIPREFVTPREWQKHMGLIGKDKNAAKAKAQQLFPHLKVIHATADALLLAEYCRRWKTF